MGDFSLHNVFGRLYGENNECSLEIVSNKTELTLLAIIKEEICLNSLIVDTDLTVIHRYNIVCIATLANTQKYLS